MTATLSLELKDLLSELRRRNWTLIRWGPEDSPQLWAAMFKWLDCADVFILRSEAKANAYRVPTPDGDGIFNPGRVFYQYHASPLWTLRAILALPEPRHPEAPTGIEGAAPECLLPERLSKPVVLRPLSPYRGA
ncbi:hypothetical protein [Saccharopolyspora hattusasensis]|uniref:hypothetical protein n=1 Tax=Saccharopolyspora hattusasensis TaxID=1128679 RepID=UPI003D990218